MHGTADDDAAAVPALGQGEGLVRVSCAADGEPAHVRTPQPGGAEPVRPVQASTPRDTFIVSTPA